MQQLQSLPWHDPRHYAASINDDHMVLLFSGAGMGMGARYSYLAWQLKEKIESQGFDALNKRLSQTKNAYENAWFGYFGYGLKNQLEQLPLDTSSYIQAPDLCFMQFHHVLVFDHERQHVDFYSDSPTAPLEATDNKQSAIFKVENLHSNMTKADYLCKAEHVISEIHRGQLYQANLTRKFYGAFSSAPDGFGLFQTLSQISPAAYSAYIRMGGISIISSSPELFLHIENNEVISKPIKGTAPRHANAKQDEELKSQLANSAKDRAENLMIVDLMRNDLSRYCLPGSVETRSLFDITSHATVHHMSSTVAGKLLPNATTLDVIQSCFPPGSMTGAPKIAAMKLCSQLEPSARGIYSGAIGWIGGNGQCDLSVVIRTLIVNGKRFEFQVGSGLVAESTALAEHEELMDKAMGNATALGISRQNLDGL